MLLERKWNFSTYETGQEIQGDIECHSCQKLNGKVGNDTTQCFGEGMDKGVRSLFLDDRALVIQGVDLGNADESVQSM
jgi:hypothetical protein